MTADCDFRQAASNCAPDKRKRNDKSENVNTMNQVTNMHAWKTRDVQDKALKHLSTSTSPKPLQQAQTSAATQNQVALSRSDAGLQQCAGSVTAVAPHVALAGKSHAYSLRATGKQNQKRSQHAEAGRMLHSSTSAPSLTVLRKLERVHRGAPSPSRSFLSDLFEPEAECEQAPAATADIFRSYSVEAEGEGGGQGGGWQRGRRRSSDDEVASGTTSTSSTATHARASGAFGTWSPGAGRTRSVSAHSQACSTDSVFGKQASHSSLASEHSAEGSSAIRSDDTLLCWEEYDFDSLFPPRGKPPRPPKLATAKSLPCALMVPSPTAAPDQQALVPTRSCTLPASLLSGVSVLRSRLLPPVSATLARASKPRNP